MPVYEYLCPNCGPFSAARPLAEYQQPGTCGGCGAEAPRALLTAPAFAATRGAQRKAFETNERSANAPVPASAHPVACGCCRPTRSALKAEAVPAKSSQRPWMIGH